MGVSVMADVEQSAVRPRIVGRYALFDEIAAGGMATIHLGRLVGPVGFGRTVAIKTLHPQFAKDPDFVEMFLQEARLASRVHHPNVIRTEDVATEDGEVFLVMEYIAGESLARLIRNALKRGIAMPVDIAASILSGTLHGLHAAHEAKNENMQPMHIVHRDVSPQNIMVGLDGVARIFDFGVAKAVALHSQATSSGQMKGKLSYMSPEQLNSKQVDRRTDVFAAGVVAWECLAGRRLFAGSDPGEVLAKVLTLDIPELVDVVPGVPRALSDVIKRALERAPAERWQSAREFAIALEEEVVAAPAHKVGAWVAEQASEGLQERQAQVENVERASIMLSRPPAYDARANNLEGPATPTAGRAGSSAPERREVGGGVGDRMGPLYSSSSFPVGAQVAPAAVPRGSWGRASPGTDQESSIMSRPTSLSVLTERSSDQSSRRAVGISLGLCALLLLVMAVWHWGSRGQAGTTSIPLPTEDLYADSPSTEPAKSKPAPPRTVEVDALPEDARGAGSTRDPGAASSRDPGIAQRAGAQPSSSVGKVDTEASEPSPGAARSSSRRGGRRSAAGRSTNADPCAEPRVLGPDGIWRAKRECLTPR